LDDWKEIEIKFSSQCIECDGWIMKGESALWLVNVGIKHKECPTGITEEDDSRLVIIEPDEPELLGIKN